MYKRINDPFMKKYVLPVLSSFYILYACSDSDRDTTRDDLVQSEFAAVTQSNNSLFTGTLNVYPCNEEVLPSITGIT